MMTYTFIIIYPYNSSLISNFRKSSSIIINHQSFTLQYLNSSGFQQLQPFSAQCGVSPRMSFGNSSAARGSGAMATSKMPWISCCARGIPPGPGCRRNRRNWESLRCWDGDGSKPWYLVNPKIAGKWMFIPLKMVLIGIDPYPDMLAGWWWLTYPITMVNDDGYYMVIIHG